MEADDTTFSSSTDLAAALRRAEAAHGQQAGKPLPQQRLAGERWASVLAESELGAAFVEHQLIGGE